MKEVFELRVVDTLGYCVATVLLKGTVDGILRRKDAIISYISRYLQIQNVQEGEIVFIELYDMSGQYIATLN